MVASSEHLHGAVVVVVVVVFDVQVVYGVQVAPDRVAVDCVLVVYSAD